MKKIGCLLILISLFSCGEKTKEKKETTEEKAEKTEPITYEEVEKLAGDFIFTEGPAVDAEGNVYFTDIPAQKILIWTVDDQLKTFKENSGGANGLFFDKDQNVLACEQSGIVSSTSPEGDYTKIATEYNGERFNQPNDVWADGKGGAYFTDPKYSDDPTLPQGGMHVYYIHPDRKQITRVCDDLVKPNGLIGTPDGKKLYVTDHEGKKTFEYKIEDDGSLTQKSLFANVGGDGMTIDNHGNVYLTTSGKKAVDIFSSKGELITSIDIPEQPSNVSFGGKNRDELYITARTSLYRVEMNVKGVD
jgi:gluconolactonase